MDSKWTYIGYAAAWVSMAAVTAVCIIVTQRIAPMWFMLFPLCISVKSNKDKEDSEE